MTDVADAAPSPVRRAPSRPRFRDLLGSDGDRSPPVRHARRASAVILLAFELLSGGKFLQPTNIVTLAVQAAAIAIIATGMVLVIVSRNIDLSVGSIVGVDRDDLRPADDRLAAEDPGHRPHPVQVGHRAGPRPPRSGRSSVRFQGFIIAYIGVPSFIVTLGGLLSFRGIVWYMSSGAAVSGLRSRTSSSSAGARRAPSAGTLTLGSSGSSVCVAIVGLLINSRRQRRRFGFPLRPMWAEVLLGVVGSSRSSRVVGVRERQPVAAGPRRSWSPPSRTGDRRRQAADDPDRLPVPDHPAHRS